MEKVKCPKCSTNNYTIINGPKMIKELGYGLLRVELRQCNKCYRRYRVATYGENEFYC